MKEVMMEDQTGRGWPQLQLPLLLDSPTPPLLPWRLVGMERGPNLGAPPAHSVPTQRPLERLMRDMGLEAKDGDIIFPITHVGRPPPYDHELSTENHKRAEGSNEENMLSPPPSNPQCRDSETGGQDPGRAPHGSVY